MSGEYFDCIYNLWTGFVGKATCEAGYLKCDGFSCPMYAPKKDPKPMTNADRIRQMSDEELAEILHNAGGNWYSVEYWSKWLKSPVDMDGGET